MSGCRVDYMDLSKVDSSKTKYGNQVEVYQDNRRGGYTVLLRGQRFGPEKNCRTNLSRGDALQILEAADEGENVEEILSEVGNE